MPDIQVQEKSPSETCPLCRADLGDAGVVNCGSCGTAYHAQCGAEFGSGCPTAGCSAPIVTKSNRVRRVVFGSDPLPPVQRGGGFRSEIGSLLLLAFGIFGAMSAIAVLVVEKRVSKFPVLVVLVSCVVMTIVGWFLKPDDD